MSLITRSPNVGKEEYRCKGYDYTPVVGQWATDVFFKRRKPFEQADFAGSFDLDR